MNSFKKLQGKVAFVQGGSRGIGAAIVKRLTHDGAAVVFTYVTSQTKSLELVNEINEQGGQVMAVEADSTKPEAIRKAIHMTLEHFGGLDIVVNNAGVMVWESIDDLSLDDWERTMNTNVRSAFITSQEAALHMNKEGRIINIGSTNAERVPFIGGALYSMSKTALVGLTKGLARDLGPRGITVNTIQPGPVDTDMNPGNVSSSEQVKSIGALGRYGKAEEIASFVAFIAGPEASYITGACLMIDGGFSI